MLGSRYVSQASGGEVPRCFLFRLLPILRSGMDPGDGPWPVRLRQLAGHRPPDIWVGDSGVRGAMKPSSVGDPPVGPFVIDPDGERASYSWLVEYVDAFGDVLIPGDATEPRGRVLWDSGIVADGAVITSPVLDMSAYKEALIIIDNQSAGNRNLTMTAYLESGVSLGATPAIVQSFPGVTHNGYGMGAGVTGGSKGYQAPLPTRALWSLSIGAGGGNTGRMTIIGRR